MSSILDALNPEQREVVLHDRGPLLVASTAGSGKTESVTTRIARLIQDGVHPSKILAVTFSKKAAEEMTTRVRAKAGPVGAGARVGTFHSLAYEILKSEIPAYKDWIVDERNKYRLTLKIATGYQKMKWKDADVSFLEQWIGYAKNELALPASDKAMELAKLAYKRYPSRSTIPQKLMEAYATAEELRKDQHILTFDDMLVESCRLIEDETVRLRWAQRYEFMIQDEAQDMCFAMNTLGNAFSKDHRNYMVVGDVNQAIYAFRGARPEFLLNFEKEWDAKVIRMVRNYRSGYTIIEAANKVMGAMNPATKMDLVAVAERPVAGEIKTYLYDNFDAEGVEVANRIVELHADGHPWSSMAILFRTNAQSRGPEEALITKRIPYRILGGVNFYERKEVKDLLAYLRAASGGSFDEVSRCINSPTRYLGKKFIDRVEHELAQVPQPYAWAEVVTNAANATGVNNNQRANAEKWATLITELRSTIEGGGSSAKPSLLLEKLIVSTEYVQYLVQEEGQESTENNRVSNIRELVRAADRFLTVSELLRYIDLTIRNSKRNTANDRPDTVTLCSCHRSKGLEYPIVFVIGCNENVLPHIKGDLDEERRLFYVAITRAKDKLYPSCVQVAPTVQGTMPLAPSRFLKEAGFHIEAPERKQVPLVDEVQVSPIMPDPIDLDMPF